MKTRLFKLTDENDRTYNGTQWGEGVTHTASGDGDLCGPGWLHAYEDPLLAVLLNPLHANFATPHLWEAEGEIGRRDKVKVGCRVLTTLKRLALPAVTTRQRVRFGILCALEVCTDTSWREWAEGWLNGRDCGEKAARKAAAAAEAAAARAARAAEAAVYNVLCNIVPARTEARAAAWAAAWVVEVAARAAVEAAPLNLPALATRALDIQ